MATHEQLARSFLDTGADYERYRPGFPAAAVELIVPTRVSTAVDLGAGTGKLTERLVERADRVVAIDPSEAMLDQLRAKLPHVDVHVAGAEAIPSVTAPATSSPSLRRGTGSIRRWQPPRCAACWSTADASG